MPQLWEFLVDVTQAGFRLDLFLAVQPLGITRSQIKKYIEEDRVQVNGLKAKAATKLKPGDVVTVAPPSPGPEPLRAEAYPLDILYEDDWLVVVNKPAGLTVHPAPGHATGTLVNALLCHCPRLSSLGGPLRPGIVHRLDKDTSGALVVAKDDDVQLKLASQFKAHTTNRLYYALVYGHPRADEGTIEKPLGRDIKDRKKISPRATRVRRAITHYRVVERLGPCSLLEVRPLTGRTHQIRVHLKEMGYPVVGDKVYGRRGAGPPFGRQALHAWLLGFFHPVTGQYVQFRAPLPKDMEELIAALRSANP